MVTSSTTFNRTGVVVVQAPRSHVRANTKGCPDTVEKNYAGWVRFEDFSSPFLSIECKIFFSYIELLPSIRSRPLPTEQNSQRYSADCREPQPWQIALYSASPTVIWSQFLFHFHYRMQQRWRRMSVGNALWQVSDATSCGDLIDWRARFFNYSRTGCLKPIQLWPWPSYLPRFSVWEFGYNIIEIIATVDRQNTGSHTVGIIHTNAYAVSALSRRVSLCF